MNSTILKERTRDLGISTIEYVKQLDGGIETTIIQKQIIRSATSVGANYRATCRAKSRADFVHKLKIVEDELDETIYWLEVISRIQPVQLNYQVHLLKEANELLSIIVTSLKTLKKS